MKFNQAIKLHRSRYTPARMPAATRNERLVLAAIVALALALRLAWIAYAGFEPTLSWSAHRIREPRFAAAIARYLERERAAVDAYVTDAAARLPFRAYGAGEGLEGTSVRYVTQDVHGFIWVATNTGVARFDGHEFRNYGAGDGLPFASARKIVETKDGGLLVLGTIGITGTDDLANKVVPSAVAAPAQ